MSLEQLDRRLFLRGLMLTSAGLVVPKPVQVGVPASVGHAAKDMLFADVVRHYAAMAICAHLAIHGPPP